MTITTITSSGYETNRLEQQELQRQEGQKTTDAQHPGTDRISISEEARLKATMLKSAQESDGLRPDVVADIKNQIAAGTYKPNGKDIAASLVKQELDIWG